jgi:hypothetical protein
VNILEDQLSTLRLSVGNQFIRNWMKTKSLTPEHKKEDPMSTLLEVYSSRPDLKEAFPEVAQGNYQRLVNWAAKSGITNDSANQRLRPHSAWYVEHRVDEAL